MKVIFKNKATGHYLSWDKFFHFENSIWNKEDVIELKDAEKFDNFDASFFQRFQEEYSKISYNQELRKLKLNKLVIEDRIRQ